jgi:hypothetical protein
MEDERTTMGGQEESEEVQVPPTSSRLGTLELVKARLRARQLQAEKERAAQQPE